MEKSELFKIGDIVYTTTHAVHQDDQRSLSNHLGEIVGITDKWRIAVRVKGFSEKQNPVEFSAFELTKVYYHDEKPYKILYETKIKTEGMLKALGIQEYNNTLAGLLLTGQKWMDVVIYKTLYTNPNGEVWVRMKDDFYENFKETK